MREASHQHNSQAETNGDRATLAQQTKSFSSLTFEAMFEAVLHDNKELLQRWVVWVQRSSKAQGRLDQTFNT